MAGLPWLVLVLSCFGRGVGSDCVVCFICLCDFGINNDRRPLAVYRVLFMEMPHLMRRSFKQVSTVNHDHNISSQSKKIPDESENANCMSQG